MLKLSLFILTLIVTVTGHSTQRSDVETLLEHTQAALQPYIDYHTGESDVLPVNSTDLIELRDMITASISNDANHNTSKELVSKLSHQQFLIENIIMSANIGRSVSNRNNQLSNRVPTYFSEISILNKCAGAPVLPDDGAQGNWLTTPDAEDESAIWFEVEAGADELILVSSIGSSVDTQLKLYDSCRYDTDSEIAQNDDFYGLSSQLSWSSNEHNSYWIKLQLNAKSTRANGKFRLNVQRYSTSKTTLRLSEIESTSGSDDHIHLWSHENSSYMGSIERTELNSVLPLFKHRMNYISLSIQEGLNLLGRKADGSSSSDDCNGVRCNRLTDFIDNTSTMEVIHGSNSVIRGRVSRASDGTPLTSGSATLYSVTGQELLSVGIDNVGRFIFSSIEAGSYIISVDVNGFVTKLYENITCPGGPGIGCTANEGNIITIGTNEIIDNIDFTLSPNPTISGKVTNIDNLQLANAEVKVFDSNGDLVDSDFTDNQGMYLVAIDTPGNYFLVANRAGFATRLYDDIPCPQLLCDVTSGTPVAISAESQMVGIDFSLPENGFMSGQVITSDGSSASSTRVNIYQTDGSFVQSRLTQSNGFWEIGLRSGEYIVTAEKNGFFAQIYDGIDCENALDESCVISSGTLVSVLDETTTQNIDFNIRRTPIITGRVTNRDNGTPVSALITVYNEIGDEILSTFSSQSTGEYIASVTDSGTIFMVASSSVFVDQIYDGIDCEDNCIPLIGSPIVVPQSGTISNINFTLDPLGTISGRVIRNIDATPITSALVRLYTISNQFIRTTFTNNNGDYLFTGIVPGQYAIATDDVDLINELYNDIACPEGPPIDCLPEEGTAINVALSQDISGIDFSVDELSTISGTVSSNIDTPSSVSVRLFDSSGQLFRTTSAISSGGSYTFSRIPPGVYFILVTSQRFIDQLYNGISCEDESCDVTSGNPVNVTLGNNISNIDFNLNSLGRISGNVFDSESFNVRGASEIRLWNSLGQLVDTQNGNFGSVSKYEFTGLNPETYYLTISNDLYIGELHDDIACDNHDCDVLTGMPLIITGSEQINISFILDPYATITGRVVDNINGLPISGVGLFLVDADTGQNVISFQNTPVNGRFTISPVGNGNYKLFTSVSSSSNYIDELYDNIPCDPCDINSLGNIITVLSPGPAGDFLMRLTPKSGIEGDIRDTDGRIIGEQLQVVLYNTQGVPVTQTFSSTSGKFSFNNLSAGSYFLTAFGDLAPGTLYNGIDCPGGPPNGCNPISGTEITLPEGQSVNIGQFRITTLTGSISGNVKDALTNQPIQGTSIQLYNEFGLKIKSDFADSNGNYLFSSVSLGNYFVGASNLNYTDDLYDNISCEGGPRIGCPIEAGTAIGVANNSVIENINFSLTELGTLSGHLVNSLTGEAPIGSSRISLYDESGDLIANDVVFSSGQFMFNRLQAGIYYLLASSNSSRPAFNDTLFDGVDCDGGPQIGCSVFSGQAITLSESEDIDITFAVQPLASIRGNVLREDNLSPLSATVSAFDENGVFVASTNTNSGTGEYSLQSLQPGSYRVAVSSSNGYIEEVFDNISCSGGPPTGCDIFEGSSINIINNESVPDIDFELSASSSIVASAKDSITGETLSTRFARLYDSEANLIDTKTFANIFTFNDLPPGTYYMIAMGDRYIDSLYSGFDCEGGAPSFCNPLNGTAIIVGDAENITIDDFFVDSNASISGFVSNSSDGLPSTPSVRVRLFDQNGLQIASVSTGNGAYSFPGIGDGQYFAAIDFSLNYIEEVYNNIPCPGGPFIGCSPTAGTPIVITDNQSVDSIDFQLDFSPGIAVTTIDSASLIAVPSTEVKVYSQFGDFVSATFSNSNGISIFANLEPGEYLLTASNNNYESTLYPDIRCDDGEIENCDSSQGQTITVASTSRTQVLYPMRLGRGISGIVRDRDTGELLSNTAIDIWRNTSGILERSLLTSPTGGFSTILSNGDYLVSTDNGMGFRDEVYNDIPCFNGPAILDLCDIFTGEPVTVDFTFGENPIPTFLTIELDNLDDLLSNGFEDVE